MNSFSTPVFKGFFDGCLASPLDQSYLMKSWHKVLNDSSHCFAANYPQKYTWGILTYFLIFSASCWLLSQWLKITQKVASFLNIASYIFKYLNWRFLVWKNIFTEWKTYFTLETTLPLRKETIQTSFKFLTWELKWEIFWRFFNTVQLPWLLRAARGFDLKTIFVFWVSHAWLLDPLPSLFTSLYCFASFFCLTCISWLEKKVCMAIKGCIELG